MSFVERKALKQHSWQSVIIMIVTFVGFNTKNLRCEDDEFLRRAWRVQIGVQIDVSRAVIATKMFVNDRSQKRSCFDGCKSVYKNHVSRAIMAAENVWKWSPKMIQKRSTFHGCKSVYKNRVSRRETVSKMIEAGHKSVSVSTGANRCTKSCFTKEIRSKKVGKQFVETSRRIIDF